MKHDLINHLHADVLTTEEMLRKLPVWDVHDFVDGRMEAGRRSELKGWAMSTILEEVKDRIGPNAVAEARRYIVDDVCNQSS